MLNKKLIVIAMLAGSALASVAQAKDGTVNFTGNITDAACTITPTSVSQSVSLGTVSATGFKVAGDSSSSTKFSIVLGSCPESLKTASVKFDGPSDPINSSLIGLTKAEGMATGVAVGIFEQDSTTTLPVGVASSSKTLSKTADTTFEFIAKYVSTTTKVKAGSANATSDFSISYN